MTRWKREFREWAKREGLCAWAAPLHWRHWKEAKAASRLTHNLMSSPAFKAESERTLRDLIIYGSATFDPSAALT